MGATGGWGRERLSEGKRGHPGDETLQRIRCSRPALRFEFRRPGGRRWSILVDGKRALTVAPRLLNRTNGTSTSLTGKEVKPCQRLKRMTSGTWSRF
jgi:hypothetical protein